MLDQPLSRPHRLQYLVRGPEWAFAIPQGDMDALDDVMRRCAQFWNGCGSLIVPVAVNGRIPAWIEQLLRIRPVEQCFVHDALGERPRAAVTARLPHAGRLWDRFDDAEVHPALFAPVQSSAEPRPPLLVPRFSNKRLQRATTACWGYLNEEDLWAWQERFDLRYLEGPADAAEALVAGQTEVGSTSPLRLSTRFMGMVSQTNAHEWPYLMVLRRITFDELVWFWNWRSRAHADVARGASVVGIPRNLLSHEGVLRSVPAWLAMPRDLQRTPELLVVAREQDRADVDRALDSAGLDRYQGTELRTTWGEKVVPRDRATYRYFQPFLGGRLVRGASDWVLALFDQGRLSLDLTPPEGFDIRSGHRVRLTLLNLPLPLPLTERSARRMMAPGSSFDGLTVAFAGSRRISFDLALPSRYEALEDWSADHACTAKPTQPSRYAEALLARLREASELDALADKDRMAVLRELAPTQRQKLAQRMRSEFAEADIDVDANVLAERLKEVGLFLELESRSATDLGGLISANRPAALRALEPLVASGFVVRGYAVRCPTCNMADFRPLRELDEYVQCRACRATHVLPVTTPGGSQDPPIHFRLDGLMARAMDQDVLPVLLALRASQKTASVAYHPLYAWPGVEFEHDEKRVDVDLLVYNGQFVVCCECKANAETLTDDQLDDLLTLCDRLEARPALAALRGGFAVEQQSKVRAKDGFVFDAAGLLA